MLGRLSKSRSIHWWIFCFGKQRDLGGQDGQVQPAYHSCQTKRVCRSTLTAEASHLSEAVEAGDWSAVLLDEALHGKQNLKQWDRIVEARCRIYVTDSQSVYDYLHKDSTSTSSDKRMAIEGALLRETVRREGDRWRTELG